MAKPQESQVPVDETPHPGDKFVADEASVTAAIRRAHGNVVGALSGDARLEAVVEREEPHRTAPQRGLLGAGQASLEQATLPHVPPKKVAFHLGHRELSETATRRGAFVPEAEKGYTAPTPTEYAAAHPEVADELEQYAVFTPTTLKEDMQAAKATAQDIGVSAAAAARRMLAKPGEAVQAAKNIPGRVARLGAALREITATLMKEGGPLTPTARKIATVATAATILLGVGGGVTQFDFEGKPAPKEAVAAMPNPGANHAIAPSSPRQDAEQPPKLYPKQGAPIEEEGAPALPMLPHQASPEPPKKHEEKTPNEEKTPHKSLPNHDNPVPKPHPGNDTPPTPKPPATEKPPQSPEEPAQPPTPEPPVEQSPAQPNTGQNPDGVVNPQLQQRTT